MQSDLPDLGPRKKAARDLAKKLIKSAKIILAPVSLQIVIQHLQKQYDLEVKRMDVGEKVSGILVRCREVDADYTVIGFNENHHWHRRRFTIAHEIGHLLLGHVCTGVQESKSHNEKEADTFAGELLIPTALIKKDYAKHADLKKLSELYRVSPTAMTIKLMEARVI